MGRHSKVESPTPPGTDPLTTTGSHRAVGNAPRRRIARWPIVTIVLVALLAVGWIGWNWAEGLRNSRAQAQGSECPEGPATIRVVVAPSARAPIVAAARSWNEARTVVHAHCVHVDVAAMPSENVLDALSGRTDLATIGGLPAAWVPESSRWLIDLKQEKPGLLGASGESVASAGSADYPFIGLSADGITPAQQRAAQSFRAYLLQPQQRPAFTESGLTPPR